MVVSPIALVAGGAFWSDRELERWQERAASGPYKEQADAFDPLIGFSYDIDGREVYGEWSRLAASAEKFESDPSRERVSVMYYHDGNKPMRQHLEMLDTALFALVSGDTALMDLVKDEVMWHVTSPTTQLDTSKLSWTRFGSQQVEPILETDRGNWWQAAWVLRMLVIADLTRDRFSESEMSALRGWVDEWAGMYEGSVNEELKSRGFKNRTDRDYENNLGGLARNAEFTNEYAYQTASGEKRNRIAVLHKYYNNRRAEIMMFVGMAGAFLDNAKYMDRAKLYFEEWLQFSVFPDGSSGEFERNGDYSKPQQGFHTRVTTSGQPLA